jgi:hypothetical protein
MYTIVYSFKDHPEVTTYSFAPSLIQTK